MIFDLKRIDFLVGIIRNCLSIWRLYLTQKLVSLVPMLLIDSGLEELFAHMIVIASYIEAIVRHRSHDSCRRVIVYSTKHFLIGDSLARYEPFVDLLPFHNYLVKFTEKHFPVLEFLLAAPIVVYHGAEDRNSINIFLVLLLFLGPSCRVCPLEILM